MRRNCIYLLTNSFTQLILSASIYSFAIFACFSVFAIITNKRTAIFAGAVVSSLVLGLVSLFLFRGSFVEAFVGLVLGILYVVIDTQIMIARSLVRKDVFTDAKILFVDFVKIFIEILKLLNKEEKKKN